MTLQTVSKRLFEAEQAALDLVTSACSSAKEQAPDYIKMNSYLAIARRIGQVRSSVDELINVTEAAPSPNPVAVVGEQVSKPIDVSEKSKPLFRTRAEQLLAEKEREDSEYPVYFTLDGKLYKVGRAREGAKSLYKKSVALGDVWRVFEELMLFASENEPVSIGFLGQRLSFPPYKIQLTVMALVECKQFKLAGRGRYLYIGNENPSPDLWMELLDNLPKRGELLDKI